MCGHTLAASLVSLDKTVASPPVTGDEGNGELGRALQKRPIVKGAS